MLPTGLKPELEKLLLVLALTLAETKTRLNMAKSSQSFARGDWQIGLTYIPMCSCPGRILSKRHVEMPSLGQSHRIAQDQMALSR